MTATQIKIANAIVEHFKSRNGNRIERQALISEIKSEEFEMDNVGYVVDILLQKGVITDVGDQRQTKYILPDDSWSYTTWDDLIEKEIAAKEKKEKKDNLDLKIAERIYKTYPYTQFIAWVTFAIALLLALLRLAEALKIWPFRK